MSLFNVKDAAESVKANRTERKATKEAQHFATSPFGQGLIEENKQLRSALSRIRALESRTDETDARLDQQEQWNTECELYVRKPDVPTVQEVACRECRRSFPNYPAYWPGGFHGSAEPI